MNNVAIGQRLGSETNTMTVNTMPSHGHSAYGTTTQPNQTSPGSHTIGSFTAGPNRYAADPADTPMESGTITNTGNGASFNNIMPIQVIRYCVVTQGVYPSRN
jgi:microcystin-dependent protein